MLEGEDIPPPALKVVPRTRSLILIKRLSGPGEAGCWDQEKDIEGREALLEVSDAAVFHDELYPARGRILPGPLAGSPTMRQRFRIVVVTGAGYLPTGREAPKMSRPKGTPADQVMAEIGPQIAAMDQVISRCEARYGKRTRVLDHPILGPLTAQQWAQVPLGAWPTSRKTAIV
jgi:hypothetical protein